MDRCRWCGLESELSDRRAAWSAPIWLYVLVLFSFFAVLLGQIASLLRHFFKGPRIALCGECARRISKQRRRARAWLALSLVGLLGVPFWPSFTGGWTVGLALTLIGVWMAHRKTAHIERVDLLDEPGGDHPPRLSPMTWSMVIAVVLFQLVMAVPQDYRLVPPGHAVAMDEGATLVSRCEATYRFPEAWRARRGYDRPSGDVPCQLSKEAFGRLFRAGAEYDPSNPVPGYMGTIEYELDGVGYLLVAHHHEAGSSEYTYSSCKYRLDGEPQRYRKIGCEEQQDSSLVTIKSVAVHTVGALHPGLHLGWAIYHGLTGQVPL